MAGQIRPNKKMAKIVYSLLKTPKELQQQDTKKPTERQIREWQSDARFTD